MSPTPSQIRQALQNTRKPSRTHGAKVRDAITHTKKSRAINPAQDTFSADETQRYQRWPTQGYKPCPRCKV